jgi:alpha-D-ribose 1-methylphosphonate 5-triphosphate synthase subunit PhnI
MGYVAVKGGEKAIRNAARLVDYYRLRERTRPVDLEQVRSQFRLLIDRVMGEGGLWAPEYAALAVKQTEGDPFEAAFLLRAYRTTLERRYTSAPIDTRGMRIERRISAAFREIPGGQILGPTRDYTQRLINPALAGESTESVERFLHECDAEIDVSRVREARTFRKVIDLLQAEELLKPIAAAEQERRVVDITREAVRFPAPRSAVLQMLARAETGGLMALGYSGMRGFAVDHGTVGELRVGQASVHVTDRLGRRRFIGRVRVTEAEMLGRIVPPAPGKKPHLTLGYGLCFGQNETKAICMGMLDSSLRENNNANPPSSQEFVLYHTECIEAYGFTSHLKLPHYVTFQSGLDNLRRVMKDASAEEEIREETV